MSCTKRCILCGIRLTGQSFLCSGDTPGCGAVTFAQYHSWPRHGYSHGSFQLRLALWTHLGDAPKIFCRHTLSLGLPAISLVGGHADYKLVSLCPTVFHYIFPNLRGALSDPPLRFCLRGCESRVKTLTLPVGNRQLTVQNDLFDLNVLVGRFHPIRHTEPVGPQLVQGDVLEVQEVYVS